MSPIMLPQRGVASTGKGDMANDPGTQTEPTKPAWRWYRLWLLGVFVAAIAVVYFTGLYEQFKLEHVKEHVDSWRAWVSDNLLLAVIVFFLLYAAVTSLSLPIAAGLSLAAGALFDWWVALPLVNLAATVGATVAFLSSRYAFGDLVQRRFGPRIEALRQGFERDGAFYLFVLRISPLFPFWLVNLGMGLTSLRVTTYAAVTAVGMLPGAALYIYAGQQLAQIKKPSDIWSWQLILAFTLLGVVPLLLRRVVGWVGRWRK